MHDAIAGTRPQNFTQADPAPPNGYAGTGHANFIAGKVVAHATAFLDGRNDAIELGRNARADQIELMAGGEDAAAKQVLDASRLLVVSMMGTSYAQGEQRQDRWQMVMGALVELVRHESLALRTAPRADVSAGALAEADDA